MTTTGAIILHAQPYNSDAAGFYFASHAEFTDRAARVRDTSGLAVEEYDIILIDGTDYPIEPDQGNLATWFDNAEAFAGLDDQARIGYIWQGDELRMPDGEALDKAADVHVWGAALADYAAALVEDVYGLDKLPPLIAHRIDYEGIAYDLECGGDVVRGPGDTWILNPRDF